jgi:outer membrane protein OmpA-like peptidoglycan-associated protein
MRKLAFCLLLSGAMALPGAAYSQQSSAPETADDYVCALSGNCADQDQAAPEAAEPSNGGPRISATRGFSLARPSATSSTSNSNNGNSTRATPRRPRQVASRPAIRPTGRVDLRVDFALGSASLSASEQARMRVFAEALKRPQLSGMRFRIEGHTDSSGSSALNMALSRARAQAVADFLTSQGVPESRLDVRGYGENRPLAGHAAADPENRRVEAVRIS